MATESGFAPIDKARIYYEISGDGPPFVMIHAGVADQRQWNNEFTHFSARFHVLRYDMRGYGRSEPADGEYSHLADLTALLDHVNLKGPLILMGCSMGGGLAMNFALEWPSRSRAVIMVDAGPTGLELDVPSPPLAAEAEKAYNAGDLDRVAELETRIWFDGSGRDSTQVDPAMRRLVLDMNRTGLAHDARHLGKRLPDTQVPAVQRLSELRLPVLVVVGVHDTAYILAAADILVERIRTARKVVLDDAAHLPNLDHPEAFQRVVTDFLDALPA